MKACKAELKVSALNLAVQGALAAMFVMPMLATAADVTEDDVAAIRHPTNYVEVGVEGVSRSSEKFGEYNGLRKSGAEFLGNFSVRGGDAYEGGDGTVRWGVDGSDLGTTSRSLGGEFSHQSKWKLGVTYDELRHETASNYQTPYQGSMGGSSFTLPTGFGTAANTRTLTTGQLGAYHTNDIGTTRKNTSLNAALNLTKQWTLSFDYNHLDQTGAKLLGFGSNPLTSGGAGGEAVSILPNPTNYKTDTVNLGVSWVGDNAHFNGAYFGSFFRDKYDRVTFQAFNIATNPTQTMSTAPSNDFHQLNLTGGYAFSAKTKLAGGFSYGRNTQNESFVVDPVMMITPSPQSSLNGVVATTHADVRLTDQSIKDLALSAGLKYDKRNNRTASYIYNFNAISGSAGNIGIYPNTPLSTKKTTLELAGDYRLTKNQHIRLAYDHEQIDRWCGQYAVNPAYPAGTNCVVAKATRDNKLSATYKFKAAQDLSLDVGYAYSKRRTDFDENAIAAFIGSNGGSPGRNAGDFVGFHPYFDASRKEQALKAGVNWQANERLSFAVSSRYTDDDYDTTYGVQKGNTWSLNLDTTYTYSDNGSVSVYLTQQHRERDLMDKQNNAAVTANATRISVPTNSSWTNRLQDEDITVGLGFKQRGLMHGKLELAGDLTYSLGKSDYGTQLNYTGTTSGGLTCASNILMSCGDLPTIKSEMVQLKLAGTYELDKKSRVALTYLYRRLHGDDYFYNGYQYGYTPNTLLATNQQPGNYSVNIVAASYIYNFK
jgi:MtrB/PioB family decaheme-associated outer membrane protein